MVAVAGLLLLMLTTAVVVVVVLMMVLMFPLFCCSLLFSCSFFLTFVRVCVCVFSPFLSFFQLQFLIS